MYPDVEQYMAAIEAARETFDAAYDAARDSGIRHTWDGSACARCEAEAPFRQAYSDARDAAWETLKGSTEPLVRWIAENCSNCQSEALAVLQALPASMDELNEIAIEQEWCEVWTDFVRLADAAGVLPAESKAEAAA